MAVNRIGYPDEAECPECGRMIEGAEDSAGIVYRCENMSCMAIFDGDELFPQQDEPKPKQPDWSPWELANSLPPDWSSDTRKFQYTWLPDGSTVAFRRLT